MTNDPSPLENGMDIHKTSGLIVRGLALVPILAMFCTSAALMFFAAFKTFELVSGFAQDVGKPHDAYLFNAIEIVDIFLLAVVIQVVSVGLFQLYIKEDTSLPRFLIVETLDDLKSKLVSVIITMLAVTFLRHILSWEGGSDIFYFGAAIALVIYALTQFFKQLQ
ncbi:YqhA family protein [Aliiroseovarius sp. 2305UL8-7]|uniref:YqhA family protein n=1 Tax=Aliiroseovarius conchicola TaxID=3121637 RepID=UPI0035282301